MAKIFIERSGQIIAQSREEAEPYLFYQEPFQDQDAVIFLSDTPYAEAQLDQELRPAIVYLPEKRLRFVIDLKADNPMAYPPDLFTKGHHLITLKAVKAGGYRNLAENSLDQRADAKVYPHATANVETRNESVFAARNVIDGLHIADCHGNWPYTSWGIGQRTDAVLKIDFGRMVTVDRAVLYLRADFPHDAVWKQGTLVLSDGYEQTLTFQRKNGPQEFNIGTHCVSWIRLDRLMKDDSPALFASLRQIEIYGSDEIGEISQKAEDSFSPESL